MKLDSVRNPIHNGGHLASLNQHPLFRISSLTSSISTLTSLKSNAQQNQRSLIKFLRRIFSSLVDFWNHYCGCLKPEEKTFPFFRERIERTKIPMLSFNEQLSLSNDIGVLQKIKAAAEANQDDQLKSLYFNLSHPNQLLLRRVYGAVYNRGGKKPSLADIHMAQNPFLKSPFFYPEIVKACEKSIRSLDWMLKLQPFLCAIESEKPKIIILKEFSSLPLDLQTAIQYVIWKVLEPKNNIDLDFGGTILNQHAEDPFMKDIACAVVEGLKAFTDDYTWWPKSIPSGWEKRKKF